MIASTPNPIVFSQAIKRGFAQRCPQCNGSALYGRYLKIRPTCDACGAAVGEIRTDDIAPYFTIMIVGHIIVPMVLWLEKFAAPPTWVHWDDLAAADHGLYVLVPAPGKGRGPGLDAVAGHARRRTALTVPPPRPERLYGYPATLGRAPTASYQRFRLARSSGI